MVKPIIINIALIIINILVVMIIPGGSLSTTPARSKYDIQLELLDIYKKSPEVFQNVDVRVKKFNRTAYVVSGTFEILDTMDHRYSAILSVYSESGNEYKMVMPQIVFKHFCESMTTEQKVYPHIVAHSNLQQQGDCPIRPNKYWIKDYAGDVNDMPELPNNAEKWKIDLAIFRNKDVVGAGALYFLAKKQL